MARMGLKRYPEAIQDYSAAMCINLQDEEWKAQLLYYRGIAHVENKNPVGARIDWEAALKGTFTKVGLREQIEAELNPKTAPPTGKVYAVWGWAMSKWNGGSKK
jgi:hypothetical protein